MKNINNVLRSTGSLNFQEISFRILFYSECFEISQQYAKEIKKTNKIWNYFLSYNHS